MATQPIEVEATEREISDSKVSNMQLTEAYDKSRNTEAKDAEIEQVSPAVMGVKLIDTPVKIEAQSEEVQLVDAEGAEARGIPEFEEAELMEIDTKTEPEEARRMDSKAAEHKPVKAEAVETKGSETKKVMNKKQLPFDPEKLKKSYVVKPKGAKPTGSKPKGVRKSTSTRPPNRGKGGAKPSLEKMLAQTRKWIEAPTSYMIRNPESGCFGLSCRNQDGERSEITIAHTVDCECLDVRLMHICQHVDRLVKGGHLGRRSRDAFVIAIKIQIELSQPIPQEMRFPALKKQVIKRRKKEAEAEDVIINVVEVHNQQKLIEKWKSLEAYKTRRIWKDW
ncbi:hypothetical protein E0Z10_g834 [Xylaria hypoxylon]|uniref:Uncharacterized protein n=1 Tax=Xylaria hypoxylon TaxID=37992 RepID=A0A4Z0YVE5_9PEZI|nr:hypothetical protein E0Z10_g834 [Xylaria hypoxylon]